MGQLSDGGAALSEGMKGLSEGMEQLEEGMVTFDKEGIQELDTLTGEELEEVLIRLQATKKADEAYENHGGIAKDRKGEVKFIIETEEIKE